MTALWLWLHGWRQMPGYAIWQTTRYQAVRLTSGRWLLIVPDDPMDELGWSTYDTVRALTRAVQS